MTKVKRIWEESAGPGSDKLSVIYAVGMRYLNWVICLFIRAAVNW